MKKIFFIVIVIIPVFLFAQKNKDTVVIQTSAQCEQCKERMEKMFAYEKGVKKSNLNLETKKITVIYKAQKTSPEKIRLAIAKTGYDADDVPADKSAYENLPACCKKGGH